MDDRNDSRHRIPPSHPPVGLRFGSKLLFLVVALTTFALGGGAFLAVWVAFNRTQERHLDEVVQSASASQLEHAALGAIEPHVSVTGKDGEPLHLHTALYGSNGSVLATTGNWHPAPPLLAALPPERAGFFNLRMADAHLRAHLADVPGRSGGFLLVGLPRGEIDDDETFVARAMIIAFLVAVFWSGAVAAWLLRRFMRGYGAVTTAVRRVAAGDLTARVGTLSTDRDTAQLAQNVDLMIDRLGQLVRSNQRFIAHAAHELRSPLTLLLGELSNALERTREPESYRQTMAEALDAARALHSLTNDLLTLVAVASKTTAVLEPVDVGEIIREALRMVRTPAADRIELELRDGVGRVRGRTMDLARMLRNVLDNALAHSPDEGLIRLSAVGRVSMVEISVSDEGNGISDDDVPHLFEPFFRGAGERAQTEGTGLGLAIAREIARAHGGDIEYAGPGPTGAGATFVARLPAA